MLLISPAFAGSKFGVIYSANTGRIRSIVVTDSKSELGKIVLANGEALEIYPMAQYDKLDKIQDKLNQKTKKTQDNDRYAIVDNSGNVIGAIIADPLIDSIPNAELIASTEASTGWTCDKQTKKCVNPAVQSL